MILVDAVYINMGGGLVLLRYLVKRLQERDIPFKLILDSRIGEAFPDVPDRIVLSPSIRSRYHYYESLPSDIDAVFCFGNVPPPVRLGIPVYSYFHNVNMLTLADCRDRKQKFLFWLKRTFIKSLRRNTDYWIVQTDNTENALLKVIPGATTYVFPFYDSSVFHNPVKEKRNEFIFVGNVSGSKGHFELVEAWRLLSERGHSPVLHLTYEEKGNEPLTSMIEKANANGAKIINHGIISHDKVLALYRDCKATVYPSKNESFGLGLVEAMESGCDVIGADLPYVHSICKPSEVFDPTSPQSICDAVLRYFESPKATVQLVRDMVDDMIDEILNTGSPKV